jgi:demethylmenaquinone methyltransferase/2-methoxy-6-polyprenyl-1,4-benzoquinol methylase
MTNPYYQPGTQRSEKVAQLFARIAPRYDLINDLQSFGLHRWWKRQLIRLAAPQPGETALDVCCGTGDLAFALARGSVHSVGLDFSLAMLRVAEQRQGTNAYSNPAGDARHFPSSHQASTKPGREGSTESKGALEQSQAARRDADMALRLPRFVSGDAQHLPFDNDSFDIVTVSYGLRNLADWAEGLREMRRVARPGGRLLVLDFGKPDNALWRALYFAYLRAIVPCFGKLFCRDAQAYAYILESLRHYPAQRGVENQMREMGCRDMRVVQLCWGVMSINYGVKP